MRIYLVALGFRAVDGPHVERVSEHKLDPFIGTQIGQPVPGEYTLDRYDQVVTVRGDGFEKLFCSTGVIFVMKYFAFGIENTQIHGFAVQIDAAVMTMRVGVESHGGFPLGCGDLVGYAETLPY